MTPQEITLPPTMEMVGVFKLKDKDGKRAVRVRIKSDEVKAVIIQKFAGESNKIIVAIEKEDVPREPKIIVPENVGEIIKP